MLRIMGKFTRNHLFWYGGFFKLKFYSCQMPERHDHQLWVDGEGVQTHSSAQKSSP